MPTTSATALTSRGGKFTVDDQLVARITGWEVNPKLASSSEWGDSDGQGFTNRMAGRKDATFTAEGKFDVNDEIFDLFQPEDIAIAVLWLDAATYWDFPRALNDDFNLTVDVDTEEVIGWTSAWGADGPYYYPGHPDANARALP